METHLNTVTTALIAVFSVTCLALLGQILYVLWRRRRQRGGGDDSVVVVKGKECVFLFCWRNQSRVEPKEIASRVDDDSAAEAAAEDEVEKWRQLCGPSRVLFTIKEEDERDGIESFDSDPKLKRPFPDSDPDSDTTPFHTPCASPPYYTPSPSPTRQTGDFPADDSSASNDSRTTPFFAIDIRTHRPESATASTLSVILSDT